MAFSAKDTITYRKDERFGHKLLTPEERLKLLKPYLPPPRSRSRSPAKGCGVSHGNASHFGIRRIIKHQLYLLVFAIIHAFFSLYIRLRNAYHAVTFRAHSILHYHHRTPELIERDVAGLSRLPKHLSVVLTIAEHTRGRDELERLINEAGDIAAWCASAGIPQLSIYEKTGILKKYLPETHRALSQKLASYFGPEFPALTLSAPLVPLITSPPVSGSGAQGKHLSVVILSAEDGRDSIVDLTKTLTEMAQRSKISPADISIDLVDAELSESVVNDPDLLILFGPYIELQGYPPWQIRLTEIYHVQDNHTIGYQVFYGALCQFARAQMRFGR